MKVWQFDTRKAAALTKKDFESMGIQTPDVFFKPSSSAFFGIASLDKNYIWDVVKKYL